MICPECNGKGEVKYYREVDRDENSVTVEGYRDICHTCHGSGKKPMTNADHIRHMPDEELADLLHDYYCEGHADGLHDIYDAMPISGIREWLKQPYKEAEDG